MYTFYLFLYNYLLKPAFKELQANLSTVPSRLACFQLHTFILCSPSSLLKSQLCLLYIRPLCSHSTSCKLYFPYILGWGMLGRAGHQKDQTLIRCLEFSVSPPPPFSREGRRAGDKVSDQSCLGGWSPHKNNKITGFRGLLGGWTHGGDGRALCPDTWKCPPLPHTLPWAPPSSGCSWLRSFHNKLVI